MVEIVLADVDVGVGGPGTLGVHRAGIVGVLRWDLLMLLIMMMTAINEERKSPVWLAP